MDAALTEEIRFGYGPGPGGGSAPGPVDPDRLLTQLDTADPARAAWQRPGLAERLRLLAAARADREARRQGLPHDGRAGAALKAMQRDDLAGWVPEAAAAACGFRERLVNFWANRLTVAATRGEIVYFVQPFRDEVVRPHVAGRFATMLAASMRHPAMLLYLDQSRSVGPQSAFGLRKRAGLNENYARELLELHSMGTGYDQSDVTALARLLAGLVVTPDGSAFDPDRAEPGPKTVLGVTYGAGEADIARFTEDLALRPETATSVAAALARHFLSDHPPPALVDRMARAYLAAGSALPPVYRLLAESPEASDPQYHKIRSPHDYVVASLRAFGLTGAEGPDQGGPKGGFRPEVALERMGQPVFRPRGPDGWPDTAQDWITPPFLTARIDWAARLAQHMTRQMAQQGNDRADPVALAAHVLGDRPDPATRQAVAEAEQRWEGVAVLLASPDFMRR